MNAIFKDDEPVQCDCGCIVYSGWVNEATISIQYKGKLRTEIYTYCDNDECAPKAMYEALSKYVDLEEHCVMTASDKEDWKNDV